MTELPPQGFVLDSWPILEWIRGKATGAALQSLLEDARKGAVRLSISRINYGEVLYICRKELKLSESQIGRLIDVFYDTPIKIAPATDARVDAGVDLKSRYNISYADAFAAGLAMELRVPLVTGDPEFRDLESDRLLTLHHTVR